MKHIMKTSSRKEVASGVFETRRRMLSLPASLAGYLVLGGAARVIADPVQFSASPATGPGNPIDWQAFLKDCVPLAGELHKDSSAPGQEAYLHWLASMISRTRITEIPRAKVGRLGKLEPAVSFGVSYRGNHSS